MSFNSKSLSRPTAAEFARMADCRALGCIACIKAGRRATWCGKIEYNHATVGGQRVGHRYGYPLCEWHHQRVVKDGWIANEMLSEFGPSLRSGSIAFRATYGSDQELQDLTDQMLGCGRAEIPARAEPSERRTGKTGYSRGNNCAPPSKIFKRGQT